MAPIKTVVSSVLFFSAAITAPCMARTAEFTRSTSSISTQCGDDKKSVAEPQCGDDKKSVAEPQCGDDKKPKS